MTLSVEAPFRRHSYAPGVYINQATIVDVADISGQQLPFLQEPLDVGFKLFLDIGRDFQPEFVIGGNFKRDPETGEVTGWGGAFVVPEALNRLGFTGQLDEGNRIPVSALESVVGKKFLKLSYVSGRRPTGKLKYSEWQQIASPDEGPEALLARFQRSLSKGFPRNYAPQVLDEVPVVAPREEAF